MSVAQPGLRQTMAWIHGWLGLVAGWLLFAMFLTGTASYFRPEITQWMQPELRPAHVGTAQAADSAVAHLQRSGPDDIQWFVYLPDDRTIATRVFVQKKPGPDGKPQRVPELELDPATGVEIHARETRGGEHFYRFHFQLQLPHPWGRWLAGVCAIFMLAAIVSGVVTHKRIFADFFTLRWRKGQRSWLDAHNLTAVLGLPYHAMITYTGLITLVTMYMPWPIMANYAKPLDFYGVVAGVPADREAALKPAPLVPIGPLVADAERRWGAPAGRLVVRNPNDAAATVSIYRSGKASINARAPALVYSGADGRLLSQSPPPGPAIATAGVMLGLHIAQYSGPALRWAYFLMGLAGTAMVGTGLILWAVKHRRPNAAPFFGLKLVDRLNVAMIAAFPLGMAGYLLANRLIPAAAPGRGDSEVATMFWLWGGVALLSCLRPLRRAWAEVFALGALAFAAIPLVNTLTTTRGLPQSIARGDGLFVAFDLAMLAIALLLGFAGWRVSRAPARPVRRQRTALPAREAVNA